MTRKWLIPVAVAAALGVGACHSPPGDGEPRPERPSRTGYDPYLIEGDEIRAATSAQNLYELVRMRRPGWLTKTVKGDEGRIVNGDEAVVVYLDDRKLGMLPVLRSLRTDLPERIKFLSTTEAQLRFGPKHGSLAAIVIDIPK